MTFLLPPDIKGLSFSTCFSKHFRIVASYVCRFSSQELEHLFLTERSIFQKLWKPRNGYFYSLTSQKKCATGDINPRLTTCKKYTSEVKLFVLVFRKLEEINIQNRVKWPSSKFVRSFLTSIFHTAGAIKLSLAAIIIPHSNQSHNL